ncbi:MAG: polyribonucleotide nucleotidyltransferase, partial [Chloroflexi bacterium]|nr:polyribonucleotide nucleotidyltransferase [Chloroflexota bacterium]
LGISEIPFDGPVSATRVGYLNGELIVNPLFSQLDDSSLDLAVASTKDAVIMVEAGANEVPEKLLLEALRLGNKVNLELAELQDEIVRTVGKDKKSFEVPEAPAGLDSEVAGVAEAGLERLMDAGAAKGERNTAMDELLDQAVEKLGETYSSKDIAKAFDGLVKTVMRRKILDEGKRPDGRAPTEIRPITSEVGIVPRTHGSGLFTRGQTQVLALATLGSLAQTQRLDTLSPDDKKRFLHHYNFPSFSTGEVGRMGGPGRREIGHGSLAERALKPVIPSDSEFPYTIRLVSEVLSSNGSTSMASVCGSSMAMMDAGVPIKAPVAGVAMGLILGENGKFTVLTDIQGIEDFKGDMDFKVAGTVEGVNALQMDVKVKGITFEIMEQAMAQAREGRLFILDKMLQTISHPRETVSVYAPKIKQIKIPQEKIGGVIGPGGRTIRAIIEQTHATIDVEDDGTVTIGAVDEESMRKAIATVEGLVKEAEVGQVYTGKVVRIMDFGAFVEILPGKDGLVHISQLADYHVDRVEDEVKVGDEVTVVVTEVDRLGRVNLSRRAVSTSSDGESGDRPRPSDDSGRNGPPRRSGDGPRDRGPRPPRRY